MVRGAENGTFNKLLKKLVRAGITPPIACPMNIFQWNNRFVGFLFCFFTVSCPRFKVLCSEVKIVYIKRFGGSKPKVGLSVCLSFS